MHDPVVRCFKDDFDRFWGLLEKQMRVCPDDLWSKKAGGWPVWQQFLHAVGTVEFFIQAEGEASAFKVGKDVIMLSSTPDKAVSRTELLDLAERMQELAHSFMNGVNRDSMTERYEPLSARFGREVTKQFVMLALVRHCNYHMGCIDAIFREYGHEGVY